MSIDQKILYALVEKLSMKAKNLNNYRTDFLWLAKIIIFHKCTENFICKGKKENFELIPDYKSLLKQPGGKGLPIGNYTSQFFANLYLNELDQFMKRKLECRHYIRYVDDFIILEKDLVKLEYLCLEIDDFLQSKLGLRLNRRKTKIREVRQGIDFLGYFVKPDYVLVRRKVVARFKEKFWNSMTSKEKVDEKKLAALLGSYAGHFSLAESFGLRNEYRLKRN